MISETGKTLAVALHYDRTGAPRVVAKGRGTVGEKIVEIAREHGVAIEENEVLAGALSIASESVRTVASAAAAIVQWVSPLYYASLCVRAAQAGSAAGVAGGIGLLVVLTALLISFGALVISRKGVRA